MHFAQGAAVGVPMPINRAQDLCTAGVSPAFSDAQAGSVQARCPHYKPAGASSRANLIEVHRQDAG